MLVYQVEFPKVKRKVRLRKVLVLKTRNPKDIEDKAVKIKLVPVRAGKDKR
jgi:hypothetical protein